MKNLLIILTMFSMSVSTFAQERWFTLYSDSTALVNDANTVKKQFIRDVKRLRKDLRFQPEVVLNTQPNLIYYENNRVNLPLWDQVDADSKGFFYHVAGGTAEGKKLFGLMFNGFYLAHELAHGLQDAVDPNKLEGSYKNEYFANVVSMLYWKKIGKQQQLDECYAMIKKATEQLADPVPAGETKEQYFTEQYYKAAQDPSVYAYMQFSQFIEIYQDNSLPDFDSFVKDYLTKQPKKSGPDMSVK